MRKLLLVALAFLVNVSPTPARSIWTKFEDALRKSDVIAVARFDGARPGQPAATKTAVLEFTKVLRGDVKPGKHVVSWPAGYTPRTGAGVSEFVVFLDRTFVWHYAAEPTLPDTAVADGPLRIGGFADDNTHEVFPSLLSLSLLEEYVKTGKLTYSFRGPICFPARGKGDWEPSKLVVEGTCEPLRERVTIKGLPELKNLRATPKASMGGWQGRPDVRLSFSSARPLEIAGRVTSLDAKTGDFAVNFFVAEPELLSRQDFEAYAADPQRGDLEAYRVKLTAAAGGAKPRVLTLGFGRRHRPETVEGVGSDKWVWASTEITDEHLEIRWRAEGKTLRARFELRPARGHPNRDGRVFQDGLLYFVHAADLPGSLEVIETDRHKVVETMKFTATLEGLTHGKVSGK
jgi:hypothetical protein